MIRSVTVSQFHGTSHTDALGGEFTTFDQDVSHVTKFLHKLVADVDGTTIARAQNHMRVETAEISRNVCA